MVIVGPVPATLELLGTLGYRGTTLCCCWARVHSYSEPHTTDSRGADMEGFLEEGRREEERRGGRGGRPK